jgi:orotate phosphoribosyltransferase
MRFGWDTLSMLQRRPEPEIDLRPYSWIEVDVLLPFTCWLRAAGRDLEIERVIAPSAEKSSAFLQRVGFADLLREVGIEYVVRSSARMMRGNFSRLEIFMDQEGSSRAHSNMVAQREMGLWKLSDLRVSASPSITSVILHQLLENIREHAPGAVGGVFMQTINANSIARMQPPHRREFFSTVDKNDVLSITICDTGPSIPSTISSRFAEEHQEVNPDDSALIRFACQRTTSSKESNPLEVLEELITRRGAHGGGIGTGLYFVQETCRDLRAFLEIRSGSSLVFGDFLLSSNQRPGLHALPCSPWGGTIIQVFVPIASIVEAPVEQALPSSPGVPLDAVMTLYSVYEQTAAAQGGPLRGWASWLDTALTFVEKMEQENGGGSLLVLDFLGFSDMEADAARAIYLLCLFTMQRNGPLLVLHQPPTPVVYMFRDVNPELRLRSAVVVKHSDSCYLIGPPQIEELHTKIELPFRGQSLNIAALGDIDAQTFQSAVEPFLHVDSGGVITSRLAASVLSAKLLDAYREHVRQRLLDPDAQIFMDGGERVFRLPTGGYTRTFFALAHLEAYRFTSLAIARIILAEAHQRNASRVLAIDRVTGMVLRIATQQIDVDIEVAEIPVKPAQISPFLRFFRELDPEREKLLVVADVVSSGDSLRLALHYASTIKATVVGTFAILEARSPADTSGGPPHRAIVTYHLPVSSDIPRHIIYSDVVIINAETHLPEPSRYLPRDPIRWSVNMVEGSSHLAEVIADAGAFAIGHFEGGERHITYALDTVMLLRQEAEGISNSILRAIAEFRRTVVAQDAPVTHVLYPANTYGIPVLARRLALSLDAPELIPLEPRDLQSPTAGRLRQARGVVVVDDASASGYTLRRVVDLAEENGAAYLCAFVLANRAPRSDARTLLKLESYGRLQVYCRHLGEFPVPAFSPSDCPLCLRAQLLRAVKRGNPNVAAAAETELRSLQLLPLEAEMTRGGAAHQLIGVDPREALRIRYHLELARDVPAAARVVEAILERSDGCFEDRANVIAAVIGYEEQYFRSRRLHFSSVFSSEIISTMRSCANGILSRPSLDSTSASSWCKAVRALLPDGYFFVWAEGLITSCSGHAEAHLRLEIELARYEEALSI